MEMMPENAPQTIDDRVIFLQQYIDKKALKGLIVTGLIFLILELLLTYILDQFIGFILSFLGLGGISLIKSIVLTLIHVVFSFGVWGGVRSKWFISAVVDYTGQWGKVIGMASTMVILYFVYFKLISTPTMWISFILNLILLIVLARRAMNYNVDVRDPSEENHLNIP